MANAKEKTIALLNSTTAVDMKTAQQNDLYAVPADKKAIITHVVIHTTSASLAGGTDYDLGTGASCDTWKQTNDLSSLTTSGTDVIVITYATKYTICAASSVFGIYVNTGSTAACTATIDVFGYLI